MLVSIVILSEAKNLSPGMHTGRSTVPSLVRRSSMRRERSAPRALGFAGDASGLPRLGKRHIVCSFGASFRMERRSARFVDDVIRSEAKNLSPGMHTGRSTIPSLVRRSSMRRERSAPRALGFAGDASGLPRLGKRHIVCSFGASFRMERRSARFVDDVIRSEAKNLSPGMHTGRSTIPSLVRRRFDTTGEIHPTGTRSHPPINTPHKNSKEAVINGKGARHGAHLAVLMLHRTRYPCTSLGFARVTPSL